MEKRSVIQLIRTHLEEELTELRATDSISQQPDPRIQELERALLMYRFLPVRDFGPEDVVAPASLTEIELSGRRMWVLLVPQHGGLVTQLEGKPVQVVTPNSPLGEAMLGKKAGETFQVQAGTGTREYRIVRIL
jgi:transcription elongation GreA/GreB family factor